MYSDATYYIVYTLRINIPELQFFDDVQIYQEKVS